MADWQWFRGAYTSWASARAASVGYEDPQILERVLVATRAVARGAAAFERDGVAFETPFVNGPLLRALQAVAPAAGSRACVLDFGGALGSAFWQHRSTWADRPPGPLWLVVEQPHYVSAGRREFEGENLRFFSSIAQARAVAEPDLVIASSALQYVEEPWAALESLLALGARWVFIDRIPLLDQPPSRLCVEHVPPALGATSYPAWFLEEARFLAACQRRYRLVERFQTRLENDEREGWELDGRRLFNQGLRLARLATPGVDGAAVGGGAPPRSG